MNKDVRFIMMVGLPATGKTTKGQGLAKGLDAIKLSSDEMRVYLFEDVNCQDRNSELFQEMNRKTIELLKMGESVIYDATNTNSKRRSALIKQLPKNVIKTCVYFDANIEECNKKDALRGRKVGKEVINNMYKTMQIPMFHEGWDDIVLYPLHFMHCNKKQLILPKTYEEYKTLLIENGLGDIVDLNQDNPYHTLSVSEHMYRAYEAIKDSGASEDVKIAVLLHDIGKGFCKTLDGEYARYLRHENVSAQMTINLLKEFEISEKRIIKIATLVQLHMRMHDKKWSDKNKEKFKKTIGEDMFNDLCLLNKCDSLGR